MGNGTGKKNHSGGIIMHAADLAFRAPSSDRQVMSAWVASNPAIPWTEFHYLTTSQREQAKESCRGTGLQINTQLRVLNCGGPDATDLHQNSLQFELPARLSCPNSLLPSSPHQTLPRLFTNPSDSAISSNCLFDSCNVSSSGLKNRLPTAYCPCGGSLISVSRSKFLIKNL